MARGAVLAVSRRLGRGLLYGCSARDEAGAGGGEGCARGGRGVRVDEACSTGAAPEMKLAMHMQTELHPRRRKCRANFLLRGCAHDIAHARGSPLPLAYVTRNRTIAHARCSSRWQHSGLGVRGERELVYVGKLICRRYSLCEGQQLVAPACGGHFSRVRVCARGGGRGARVCVCKSTCR